MSEKPDNKLHRQGGINTLEIDSAREMHTRTVQARIPNRNTASSSSTAPIRSSQMQRKLFASPTKIGSPIMVNKPPTPRHKCNNPHNPACNQCGSIIIPAPAASMPFEDSPSISIGDWTISSRKKPILNSSELDEWETKLEGLAALPEMIFGNNFIRIMNTKHNWGVEYNALDALKMVKLHDTGIRVAYSKDWIDSKRKQQQKQTQPDGMDLDTSLKIVKNYDWTYSTEYEGTVIGENKDRFKFEINDDMALPIDKLSKPDQILFFDDMILFEDELADNGISLLNSKIRVMNERLLLLSRFFLRVDDVLLRVYDTRICVDFDDNTVIRETKKYEGKYDDVLSTNHISHTHDPKAALRDSNWVVDHTPIVDRRCEVMKFD